MQSPRNITCRMQAVVDMAFWYDTEFQLENTRKSRVKQKCLP